MGGKSRGPARLAGPASLRPAPPLPAHAPPGRPRPSAPLFHGGGAQGPSANPEPYGREGASPRGVRPSPTYQELAFVLGQH